MSNFQPSPATSASYSLGDLCALAGVPLRTARYYIQLGLVDRPEGETRAARYHANHLEQLLLIKKWTGAGLSLDRIRCILQGDDIPQATPPPSVGVIEVCSHLLLAPGIELVIQPQRAGLAPEQLRHLLSLAQTWVAQARGKNELSTDIQVGAGNADTTSEENPA